jgi:GNAT superfamily N-acetyltransferase
MQSTAVTLRPATADLIECLFEIHRDAVTNGCRSHYSDDQISRWFEGRSPRIYLDAIESQAIWIAEMDRNILGFTEYWPGSVSMLFVRSEAAGMGVGALLLDFAVTAARQDHDGNITVEATLNAQKFYEKHGFVKTGENCLLRESGLRLETVLMDRIATTGPS